MKKFLILSFMLIFLFSSCGGPEIEEEQNEKNPFYVQTEKLGNFGNEYFLEKTSKIDSIGEIFLTSEVYGELENLNVREGDKVYKGETLATLNDTTGNISIAYKQAKLNLEQAINSYDTQKISLDKSVFDAKLNLEKLEINYETLKKNTEENLKQAKDSFDNSVLDSTTSKSSLDLDKLDESIKKLEFDYETTKTSNEESLKSFLTTLQKDLDNLQNSTEDIFDFGDKLFYITGLYSKDNDFDDYFGRKNSSQKNETKILLQNLYNFKNTELKNIKIENIDDLEEYGGIIEKGYELNKVFLQAVEQTINNSITSVGVLSTSELSGYNATINGYQTQIQSSNTAFVALTNSINTFLNTYKKSEESIQKQIELTKKDREILQKALQSGELNAESGYNKTVINSVDSLKNMEISIKNAENLLETAEKNRNVSLKTLENNITGTKIALEKANISYSKLNLKSPIDGIVSEVLVDIGQSYPSGTKFLKIVSDSENELFVYFPIEELEKINIGDNVFVSYRNESFTGTVFSKSNLADDNLNYKVKVNLPKKLNFIGGVANLKFGIKTSENLLPINIVKIIGGENKIGQINVFSGGTLETREINLGKTFGDKIEFSTDLPDETEIILNDMSNYNKNKFELEKK